MVRQTIYRISLVKMLYAQPSRRRKGTPEPFVEIRSFIFSKVKPTPREEILYRKGLEAVINHTENLFTSIVDAKTSNALDQPDWGDLEQDMIRAEFPATPRAVMEIEGYEVERIDVDEVAKFFKDDNLSFDEIYRYVGFRDNAGDVLYDYDEAQIASIASVQSP